MKFNDIYNVTCELTLESGREIILETLIQKRTYAGLQMGTPNKESNDQVLQWHLDYARSLPEAVGAPYLIPPVRCDYHIAPGDMQSILDEQADRPLGLRHIPEWLPGVYAVGVFNSLSPARDKQKDFSRLSILWYQPDFGVDAHAMKPICQIDWNSVATDLEW